MHSKDISPNKPAHEDILEYYAEFSRGLGLPVILRPPDWTPSKSQSRPPDDLLKQVQFLYYRAPAKLQVLRSQLRTNTHSKDWLSQQLATLVEETRPPTGTNLTNTFRAVAAEGNIDQQKSQRPNVLIGSFETRSSTTSFASATTIDTAATAATSFDGDPDMDGSKKRPIDAPSHPHDATKRSRSSPTASNAPEVAISHDISSIRNHNISHQLKSLHADGFGRKSDIARDEGDWRVHWELARAIDAGKLTADAAASIHDYESMKLALGRDFKPFERSNAQAFVLDAEEMGHYTLSATITLNPKNVGPLFLTKLEPIKPEQSCRAQRKVGWTRILYAKVILSPVPSHLEKDKVVWTEPLIDWLIAPHQLLGRTWRAFHIEEYKTKRSLKSRQRLEFDVKRVAFIATDGYGLIPRPFESFVDWLVPLKFNADQAFPKAAARIDLALSRTKATIVFKPEQIKLINDMRPTTSIDEMPFQDEAPRFQRLPRREHNADEAMTDGCGIISVGAALEICKVLGLSTRPAAFQARIYGSKGLWIVSDMYDTVNKHHLGIWIEIRASQLKVLHGQDAKLDAKYRDDESLRCFDVHFFSHPARSSDLHRDFLNILVDRGIKPATILQFVKQNIEDESAYMERACSDPEELVLYLQRSGHLEPRRMNDHQPVSLHQQLMYFVSRGGFMPISSDVMANRYQQYCCRTMLDDLSRMRIRCAESTILFGVPDPFRCLKPGEVHICFSRSLEQSEISTGITSLAGKHVLIARDPTLRGSDIQKYECVYKTELAHLQDVVVFSTNGNMPAAARHQGGDYDGDRFAVLWPKSLVDDFKNVPVPRAKSHRDFGIEQERRTLGSLYDQSQWGSKEHCDVFMQKTFRFRMQHNFLGVVTNLFYTYTYNTGDIWSSNACDLADLHDLLIDSLKQGFTFDNGKLLSFKRIRNMSGPMNEPEYKTSFDNLETVLATKTDRVTSMRALCAAHARPVDAVAGHILDQIYFSVKLPHVAGMIDKLDKELQGASRYDDEILIPVQHFKQSYAESPDLFRQTMEFLGSKFADIDRLWVDGWVNEDRSKVDEAIEKYRSLRPPAPVSWMHYEKALVDCTVWDRLCASAYYQHVSRLPRASGRSKMTRVFKLAPRALCQIKSGGFNGKSVVETLEALQRFKRSKKSRPSTVAALEANGQAELSDEHEKTWSLDSETGDELLDDDQGWDEVLQEMSWS